jgi:hypothetical protein
MIAPDGSTGDVPTANVSDAVKAGFKMATAMTSPDGKLGYIPSDRAAEARAAGFAMAPTGNTANVGTKTGAFSADAGTPVNLITGEGGMAAASRQAEQDIGTQGEQMKGIPVGSAGVLPGITAHAPASIAEDKRAYDAQTAPVPSSSNPVNIPPNMRGLEKSAEQIPSVAGAAAAFVPVGGAAKVVDEALPNAQRAGAALQDVKTVAGAVPINTAKVGDAALDLYEQSQRGATLPKAVRQLVVRMTAPNAEPLTYAEAKDFQSNISALSANEKMSLNAKTARLVGQLNSTLKDALTDAADVEGKGQQFTQAMQEYHRAMQVRDFSDDAKAFAFKTALKAAGLYGVGRLLGMGQ